MASPPRGRSLRGGRGVTCAGNTRQRRVVVYTYRLRRRSPKTGKGPAGDHQKVAERKAKWARLKELLGQ